jgi:hypothetical protein
MARTSTRDEQPERQATANAEVKAVATPWGAARLVEEVRLQQRAGDRRFSSLVQLLENPGGERLVRFAYATDGTARRGPVTLRRRDLQRLRVALAQHPALKEALDP